MQNAMTAALKTLAIIFIRPISLLFMLLLLQHQLIRCFLRQSAQARRLLERVVAAQARFYHQSLDLRADRPGALADKNPKKKPAPAGSPDATTPTRGAPRPGTGKTFPPRSTAATRVG